LPELEKRLSDLERIIQLSKADQQEGKTTVW
jgi:hypothetical protein